MVYDKAGRAEEAVATYRSATRAQPNDYRIYLDFGNYYLNRGQFQQAEELYRRVVELAPAFSNGHINLGLARMQQGRFAEAEVIVRALAALRPRDTVYVSNAHTDVSYGALRLIHPCLKPSGALVRVEPLATDLGAYREQWRHDVERAEMMN